MERFMIQYRNNPSVNVGVRLSVAALTFTATYLLLPHISGMIFG